jgi:hypothetical protein
VVCFAASVPFARRAFRPVRGASTTMRFNGAYRQLRRVMMTPPGRTPVSCPDASCHRMRVRISPSTVLRVCSQAGMWCRDHLGGAPVCGPLSAKGAGCVYHYDCQGNLECSNHVCVVREGVTEVPPGGLAASPVAPEATKPNSSGNSTTKQDTSADATAAPDSSADATSKASAGAGKGDGPKKGGSKLPIIAGAVSGSFAALALLGLACFCCVKKRRAQGPQGAAVGRVGGPDGGETWVDMMKLDMSPVEGESTDACKMRPANGFASS